MKFNRKILVPLLGLLIGIALFNIADSYFGVGSFIERIVDSFTDQGKTPSLHKLARQGNTKKIIQLLDDGADPNEKDKKGRTPLHTAALYGQPEAIKILAANGNDIDACDNQGNSPLHLAAYKNQINAIKQLIASGANIDGKSSLNGTTPLFTAVWQGHEKAVKTLIKLGADVNSGSPLSPLHCAADLNRIKISKILLENGADIEQKGYYGITAFYIAAVSGNQEMVTLLRKHGADESITDRYGQSPSQTAEVLKRRNARSLIPAKNSGTVIDVNAIVQIVPWEVTQDEFPFKVNRNGFAIGDGSIVVTAAHCIDDFIEDGQNGSLIRPLVMSRYYGDVFQGRILAFDEKADIAIMKVDWPGHPALELSGNEQLNQAQEVIYACYLPPEKNGSKQVFCKEVFTEKIPIVRHDSNAGNEALVIEGSKFVDKGWSGSPFILDNGKVAGVLALKQFAQINNTVFLNYVTGGDANSILTLLAKNNIDCGRKKDFKNNSNSKDGFFLLIDLFESLTNRETDNVLIKAKALVDFHPNSVNARLLLADFADAFKNEDTPAQSSYEKALELDPDNFMVQARYANFFLRHGQKERAAIEFKKANELENDNSFVLLKLVKILKDKDVEQAQIFGERLVEKYPDNAENWFELANVFWKAKKYDQEVDAAKKAVSLNKTIPFSHRRRLADALVHVKEFSQAEQQYKLLLRDHQCARCWFAYTELLMKPEVEKYDDALKALEKAESMNDDNQIKPVTIEKLCKSLLNKVKNGID